MSLFSSRVGLTQRCTIERRTLVSDGGGGRTETWAAVETDLPCRAWLDSSRTDVTGDKVVEVEERQILVPVGSDVRDGDRVTEVTLRGDVFLDGPMPINTVGRRPTHLALFCREVQ